MEDFNMGAISFTGLASGMDTDSWIQALVQIKSKSLNNISTKNLMKYI